MKNKGYVKVTKASKDDKGVTITSKRLAKILDKRKAKKFLDACNSDKWWNTRVVLDLHGIPTSFHLSRGGKTLYSDRFPSDLPQPKVGIPIEGIYVSKYRLETFTEV